MPAAQPLKTFIIYARDDEAYKKQLLLHLRPLVASRLLSVWHDGDIRPGEDWEKAIKNELKASELVIVLVSVHALNSEFIQTEELRTALDRLASGLTRVVPVVVSPCGWRFDPVIRRLQALPLAGGEGVRPVSEWPNSDLAWTNVVEQIGDMAQEILDSRAAAIAAEHVEKQRLAAEAAQQRRAREEAERRAQAEAEHREQAQREAEALRLHQAQEAAARAERARLAEAERQARRAAQPPRDWRVPTGVGGLLAAVLVVWFVFFRPEKPSLSEKTTQSLDAAQPAADSAKPAASSLPDPMGCLPVKGGTFQMGSTDQNIGCEGCSKDEMPQHSVTLSDFYIGKYEVTQKQWRDIMGSNPFHFKNCDNCPVENVSWNDVQEFLKKLNAKYPGKNYRLPTEAEWEYAARGGQQSNGYQYAGSDNLGLVAWYDGNSGNKTHPVGERKANELGLYDMSGNVWEWCSDWYGTYPSGSQTNPKGPSTGSFRVFRGGSWGSDPHGCRAAGRGDVGPGRRNLYLGFRLAFCPAVQ